MRKLSAVVLILVLVAVARADFKVVPGFIVSVRQAESPKWASPLPFPSLAEKYEPARTTQSIYILNNFGRYHVIDHVRTDGLEEKYRVSGGMAGLAGWKSEKYRRVPEKARTWLAAIEVMNSGGSTQPDLGIVREYPEGTRFDDVLSNVETGKVFEHRVRWKQKGEWYSRVLHVDEAQYPRGYRGLSAAGLTCAGCHDSAGGGGYGVGLVPGGDTVISDPLDWSIYKGPIPAYLR